MRNAERIVFRIAIAALLSISETALGQQPSPPLADRGLPVVHVQIGDVPVAIPKDWADSKFAGINLGSSRFIHFANAHMRSRPRSTHFEFPALMSFGIVESAAGLPEQNLRESKAKLEQRRSERAPDEYGFWHWKAREYVLIDTPYKRPLDQPLVVECSPSVRPGPSDERMCTVRFYWTRAASIRYIFYYSDYPKSRWSELDQRVLELLKFLDGREASPAITPSEK